MKNYLYSINDKYSGLGIADGLQRLLKNEIPVFVCIGTDLCIGDSLGPLIGSKLKDYNLPIYIYGSLDSTVTAKEVTFTREFISKAHPFSKVVAIDACIGDNVDIGNIKMLDDGIYPGIGANKSFPKIGDISIIGLVNKKSKDNHDFYNTTRLSKIMAMANVIASGIQTYINNITTASDNSFICKLS